MRCTLEAGRISLHCFNGWGSTLVLTLEQVPSCAMAKLQRFHSKQNVLDVVCIFKIDAQATRWTMGRKRNMIWDGRAMIQGPQPWAQALAGNSPMHGVERSPWDTRNLIILS